MTTSNPTNDPKSATANEVAIQDLPESKDCRGGGGRMTPDEETNVRGGAANVINSSRSNIRNNLTEGSGNSSTGTSGAAST